MRPLACVVVLLASVLGSRGTVLAPSPADANSPAAQGQASSPPEPMFALGRVTLPTGSSEFLVWHYVSDHNHHLLSAALARLSPGYEVSYTKLLSDGTNHSMLSFSLCIMFRILLFFM